MTPQASLENWRQHPFNIWGFRNVDRLITTQTIASGQTAPLDYGPSLDLASITLADGGTVADMLDATHTDGFMVLHDGRIVAETYSGGLDRAARHIVFSVSKSITGTLAGILVERGELDPEAQVGAYIPEVAGSAYADCTLRHVLDMQVAIRFVEDYLDPKGDVARYRVAMDWNPPVDFPYQGGLHDFITTLPHGERPHGEKFLYVSPNSDMLGWILERAGGMPIADLLSRYIWQPMGVESDAFITVDRHGASRTAGGICVTLADLARFGDMMRLGGWANGRQIVPKSWIGDIVDGGSRDAWARGSMTNLYPTARYRAQWYSPDEVAGEICAIGIHGQWIYTDPASKLTAVKLSSQPLPEEATMDLKVMSAFRALGRYFR